MRRPRRAAGLAVDAMRAARVRDPRNWQYAYGLAVAQALAGEDPRPSAALALRLNPLEPLARKLVRDMRSKSAQPAARAGAAGPPSRSVNEKRRAEARLSSNEWPGSA